MNLDPNVDLSIDTADLTLEFKNLSLLLYRYYTAKADAEREYDKCKGALEEVRARIYRDIKTNSNVKHTEKSIEAELDSHESVIQINDLMLDAKRNFATLAGAVDSMKAKKDMLIQLGADARKDL